jgi:NAD(P)-dependent dehydrogenase (short-subunit alcohol dehydrogenase family)
MTDARIALVTGASRGIGAAVARHLAAAGHRVFVGYARDADSANAVAHAIRSGGGQADPVAITVEDRASVEAAFQSIEARAGAVAVLVNNGGVTDDGLLVRMRDDQWDHVMAVDLTGAFNTIRRATPKMMRARFGRIVNISSVVAHLGGAGQANYAAAKAGLVGLTRSVARELGSRGITANVVAPGPIVTEMTEAMGDDWLSTVGGLVPTGRPGTVDECAATVAFLCSEAAAYVNGVVLPVDGGLGMGT